MDIMVNLTESQTEKMLALKSMIEDIYETGDMRGLTGAEVEDLVYCYNELLFLEQHCSKTIASKVAKVFKKYGFRVSEVTIGGTVHHWEIHID
jgi:hypothetical protein